MGTGIALIIGAVVGVLIGSHKEDAPPPVIQNGQFCRYEQVGSDMSGPNYDYVCYKSKPRDWGYRR